MKDRFDKFAFRRDLKPRKSYKTSTTKDGQPLFYIPGCRFSESWNRAPIVQPGPLRHTIHNEVRSFKDTILPRAQDTRDR